MGEKEKTGVSHSAIEASFDRFLMEKDGLDPVRHNVTAHLHPSQATAAVMAPFYAPITAEEVYAAEKSMVFYLKALIAHGPKRAALVRAAKLIGKPQFEDMFVPYVQNPRCIDSDGRLFELYQGAVPLAVTLIREAGEVLDGTGELGTGFDHTFGEN